MQTDFTVTVIIDAKLVQVNPNMYKQSTYSSDT